MSKKKNKILSKILFTDAGAKGVTIGKSEEGKTIMVKNAIPGDIADVWISKKKKNYLEGIAQNFTQYSSDRTTPVCTHFGVCGGCKWQNLNYSKQLFYKQKEVVNNIKKIAQISEFKIKDILPSTKEFFYRNKMEFSFSNSRWITQDEIDNNIEITNKNALGFHLPKKWNKILDIEKCFLQEDPSNAIRNFIKQWTNAHKIPYFNVVQHGGVLRTLLLKNNSKGDWMVVFQLYENFKLKEQLFDAIIKEFSTIKTVLFAINNKANDSLYDLDLNLYFGEGYLLEQIENLQFKITPKSFFQTNYKQAISLYALTRKYAQLTGKEIVYDLYTGTGTIAQYISHQAKKVIGIESVPEAIISAKENALLNNISNCHFYCGDMRDVFNDKFVLENGTPNVIITDPPREGMHKKVIENILELQPNRIVYVSCNSSTQARDILLLKEKYSLILTHPVDMFPQTHHVENIVLLELKK